MRLFAEVSAGDLIDRITILEIKLEKIEDSAKRANVAREYEALAETLRRKICANRTVARLREDLKQINAELWRIEDAIRAQERAKTFSAEFIDLARAVYRTNDRRAYLKRMINEALHSEFVEEKSYVAY
jgi:hypothetical protein